MTYNPLKRPEWTRVFRTRIAALSFSHKDACVGSPSWLPAFSEPAGGRWVLQRCSRERGNKAVIPESLIGNPLYEKPDIYNDTGVSGAPYLWALSLMTRQKVNLFIRKYTIIWYYEHYTTPCHNSPLDPLSFRREGAEHRLCWYGSPSLCERGGQGGEFKQYTSMLFCQLSQLPKILFAGSSSLMVRKKYNWLSCNE